MELDRGTLSRRGFLAKSTAGLAATGLPLWFAKELVAGAEQNQAQQAQAVRPNDAILMGHIGCGGRGNQIADLARQLKGVRYVACCDVDRQRCQEFAQRHAPTGGQVTQFKDFRELLARQDINAVTIATVDHWHALAAIAAMKAGKDVYCEKPLTLTVAEGRAIVRVAQQTNRRLQTGTQQRTEFNGQFRLACDLVRNGRIGRIKNIECRIATNPVGGPFKVSAAPPEIDWDFWMGPTPKVDYVKEKCHYTFRWWYQYSGGKMTDWGAHMLDIAQWALNMDNSGPIEVEGHGEDPDPRPLCYNCHPTFNVTYKYASGATVTAVSTGQEACFFAGEGGKWIVVTRDVIRASDRTILDPLPNNAPRLPVFTSQMGNFVDCVRNRQQPICNPEVGHRSATVCHLGTIATRAFAGQKLHWNPETEQFVGNDAANRMLSREMRAPWRLEA